MCSATLSKERSGGAREVKRSLILLGARARAGAGDERSVASGSRLEKSDSGFSASLALGARWAPALHVFN